MLNQLNEIYPIVLGALVIILVILGFAGILKAFYVKVPQGVALIVNGLGSQPKVHFTGAIVYPVVYKKEFMKISLLTLEIDRRGKEGLICRDNLRADITVAFYLKVNAVSEDVLKVAKAVGVERASDTNAVGLLFNAKFSEALKTVGKQFDMHQLFDDRQNFRDRIVDVIGKDLNGYTLEDVAIDYLEQTPKTSLDPNNIFDAEGIRKITEITATHNIVTNEAERNQEMAIMKKNVETREACLELERQQADAESRQQREIATVREREMAETLKVQQEEHLRVEQTRIKVQQEIEVQEQNRQREVEVAEQNRQRVVSIEEEKVKRARDLEVVSREREVELSRIDKEKALEEERKQIADVIRERVAVEKTVAIEEERIKEVRQVSEADRAKQVQIIEAHAQAEKNLVEQVKKAEADKDSATHRAVEIATLAQAELEAAAKQADAKKRLAEGIEAEEAAVGLAEARVRMAKAEAMEKEGAAEAAAALERMLATAKGEAEQGTAKAKVEAELGQAKALAVREVGLAQAKIEEEQGLARAKVEAELGQAKAVAAKEVGLAEAEVILQRLKSEAEGLADKFQVMNSMSADARSHEEFRLQLEKHFAEAMAGIEANKDIAKEQAEVLSSALTKSNIDIVSGDPAFFQAFAKSLSMGKAVNGFIEKSPIAKNFIEAIGSKLGAFTGQHEGENAQAPADLAAKPAQTGGQAGDKAKGETVNLEDLVDKFTKG